MSSASVASNLRSKVIAEPTPLRQSEISMDRKYRDSLGLEAVSPPTTFPREIWSVRGASWSLPIAVEWPGGQNEIAAARIGGGIRLLDCQIAAVEAKLREIGAEYDQRGECGKRWWIMRTALEQHCQNEGYVDPQTVVEWCRVQQEVRYTKPSNPQRKMREEFFREFCKGGIMDSPAKAEFIFTAFCKFILHRLINTQQPVDLGFCQLVPVPFRANWKSMLLTAHRGERLDTRDLLRPVANEVVKPQYVAWNRNGRYIYWTLEVLPLKGWYIATLKYELTRKRKGYRLKSEFNRYLSAVSDTIRRALPYARQLYAAYVSNVNKPTARLVTERRRQGTKPKPYKQRGHFFGVRAPDVVHPAYDVRNASPVAPVEFGDTDEEDCGVREVPDISSGVADLRATGSDVAESEDQANGDHGLPVSDGHSGVGTV